MKPRDALISRHHAPLSARTSFKKSSAILIMALSAMFPLNSPLNLPINLLGLSSKVAAQTKPPEGASQRFSPVARTQRFSAEGLERSQRFGIQQVGEASAEATRQLAPPRAVVNPYDAAVNRGDQFVKQGAFDRAIEQYRKAVELQPKAVNAYMGLGYTYIKLGDYDRATREFKEAISQMPNNSEAQLNLGVALYRSGRINEAIDQYQHALAEAKGASPQAHFNLAMAYSHNGDLDKAIEHYRTALEQRNNRYPEASNNLGLIYEAMKRFDEAAAQFRQAIEQQRGAYPLAHYNLARFFSNSTNFQQALDELQLAIKQQPNFPEAYLDLGNIYLLRSSIENTNELKLAVASYQKAIELRDNLYPLAHENLAIVLTKQQNKSAAIAEYRIAFEQADGLCPETFQNLITTLLDKSVFLITNELSRADNPGNLRNKKSGANDHQPDSPNRTNDQLREHLLAALTRYEEVDDELKTSADVRYCAGLAYAGVGDWRAAVDEFSSAMELSKNHDKDAAEAINAIMQLVKYF